MGGECSTLCAKGRVTNELLTEPNPPINLSPTFNSHDGYRFFTQPMVQVHPLINDRLSANQKAQVLDSVRKSNLYRLERFLLEGVQPTENLLDTGNHFTLLHASAEANAFQSMELMILWIKRNMSEQYREIINLHDYNFNTPAMICAIHDAPETLHVLLSNGEIDAEAKDTNTRSLEELCHEFSYRCLVILEYHRNPAKLKQLSPVYLSNSPSRNGSPKRKQNGSNSRIPETIAIEIIRNVSRVNINKNLDEFLIYKTQKSTNSKQKLFSIGSSVIESKMERIRTQPGVSNDTSGNFLDRDFPHTIQSICRNLNHKYYQEYLQALWKRPNEIFACDWDDIHLFEYVDPTHVVQGRLGAFCFLSCLVALTEFPARLQRIFQTYKTNKDGKYTLQFYVQGIPTQVHIDDYLPCAEEEGRIVPIFSKPKGKELWVMLAEKAWAKLYGSYLACEKDTIDQTFEYLTSYPTIKHICSETAEETLWNILCDADKANWVVSGATGALAEEQGLNSGYYYTVISVYEIGKHRILKLRNPWGKLNWRGDFSDESELWSEGIKKKVGYVKAEDGMFCMTVKDFKKYFEFVMIGVENQGWEYTYAQADLRPQHAEYFHFKVEEKTDVYLRVHLQDRRLIKGEEVELDKYPAVNFEIVRIGQDGAHSFVVGHESRQETFETVRSRSVYACRRQKLSLTPGQYFMRVKIMPNHGNQRTEKITVSAYSDHKLILQRLGRMKNLLKQLYLGIGKKGQKVETSNGCLLGYGTYGQRAYFYAENTGKEKTWVFNITFNKLDNVKVAKDCRLDQNHMKFIIPPGGAEVGWLKKIDISQQFSFDWKITEEWI